MTPDGRRLFLRGWDRHSEDTLAVDAIDLADGSDTRWVTMTALAGSMQVLSDGSLLLHRLVEGESVELYRVAGPGEMELLGMTPRPGLGVMVSKDLRWATAWEEDHHADAWMYQVVKR